MPKVDLEGEGSIEQGGMTRAYSRKVGERLRGIRKQKRLSLHEVEDATNEEFKASVLGAYERGERSISVPRLQRLAGFYAVPVDQLLPKEESDVFSDTGWTPMTEKVAINLQALSLLEGPQFEMLARFLAMIQVQRQDFNGRILTVRGDDLRAIACMLETTLDSVGSRLTELGIRNNR